VKPRHIRLAIACLGGLLFSQMKDFDCRPLLRAAEPVNPHGDFIFRVTGTKTCEACHAFGEGNERPRILDNEAVRNLIARGKGNHGPSRFADCFRCHAGGRLPNERY